MKLKFCADETKLDSGFPKHYFKIDGYPVPPFLKDKNIHGGGKMVFIREGLIALPCGSSL